jgi:hypothetical protein
MYKLVRLLSALARIAQTATTSNIKGRRGGRGARTKISRSACVKSHMRNTSRMAFTILAVVSIIGMMRFVLRVCRLL